MLEAVRTAGWRTTASGLSDIIDILAESLMEEDLDYVYSLSDALLCHDLSPYPAFYRAAAEVCMARSQPDDSEPDAEERLQIAKVLLEEESVKPKELQKPSHTRVEKLLAQVHDCLLNGLAECPSPGDPERRETQKLYQRREAAGEDEALDDGEAGEEETEDGDDEHESEPESGTEHGHEHDPVGADVSVDTTGDPSMPILYTTPPSPMQSSEGLTAETVQHQGTLSRATLAVRGAPETENPSEHSSESDRLQQQAGATQPTYTGVWRYRSHRLGGEEAGE